MGIGSDVARSAVTTILVVLIVSTFFIGLAIVAIKFGLITKFARWLFGI